MSYTKERLENVSLSDLEIMRQQLAHDSTVMTGYMNGNESAIPVSLLLFAVEDAIRDRIKKAFSI